MRKVDRLLIKIQEAQRLDELTLCYALVSPASFLDEPEDSPNYNKWAVVAYLNRGGMDSNGELLDTLYFDTKAEAMKAAKEIEAVHAPTGRRAKETEAAYITFEDFGIDEDGAAEIERQAAEGQAALQKLADEAAEAMMGTL